MKFQSISNTPKNHQTGLPRPPEVSKMRSKLVPKIIKFTKKSKIRNLMKTIVFTMFLRGWDITNQRIFQSKIIKNHACNPNMLFDTPYHRKYQKVSWNGLPWGTQNPSKIIENPSWHNPGSPWVHLCPTWSPKWSPRTSKWTQNGSLETQKGHTNPQHPITLANLCLQNLFLKQRSMRLYEWDFI